MDRISDAAQARSDVVGSLLRPPELLEARSRFGRGDLTEADLRRAEDEAVDRVLRLQEDAGLDVVTDGELRRLSFQSRLVEAVEGFGDWDIDAFLWGSWKSDELGPRTVERPPLAVTGRLRRRRLLSADEFAYARARTDRILKVTLPSPSLFANFWDPAQSTSAYATVEDFLGDVAEILRQVGVRLTDEELGRDAWATVQRLAVGLNATWASGSPAALRGTDVGA